MATRWWSIVDVVILLSYFPFRISQRNDEKGNGKKEEEERREREGEV